MKVITRKDIGCSSLGPKEKSPRLSIVSFLLLPVVFYSALEGEDHEEDVIVRRLKAVILSGTIVN